MLQAGDKNLWLGITNKIMKHRGIIIWFAVAIILIVIFLIPPMSRKSSEIISAGTRPISRALVAAGRKVANIAAIFSEIANLRKDNQRLSEDLIRAKVDSTKLTELEIENQELKKLLNYKEAHPEMKLISANVIGLDPTNFYDSVVIDRGSDDGIEKGMAVVLLGVLVGKIDQVMPRTSQVLLITSKDSIVQVMLESSRTAGVLKGGISGMTLENIPLDTPVAAEENVITSGLGGKLPKGLFVGKAGKEVSVKSDIFKTVEVKSEVNFSKLETLFVVSGV